MNESNILRVAAMLGLSAALLGGCGDGGDAHAQSQGAPNTPVPAASGAASGPVTQSAGKAAPSKIDVSKPVATLGTISISRADMDAVLRGLPSEQRLQLQADRASLDQWLRGRLAEKALIEQATLQGWPERPEIHRVLELARDQVVLRTYLESVSQPPGDYPSQQELQAAYDQSKSQLTMPARYRISQIFLAAPYTDNQAVAKARKQAADLVKQARAANADFASLAREYSQDEATAKQGGDSGEMTLQQLVPGLREVVQHLSKGEVSDPIQMPGGIHIIKVVDAHMAQVPPLAQVQDQLRIALRTQRQQQAARAYLEGLINGGTVSIDGGELNEAFKAIETAASVQ